MKTKLVTFVIFVMFASGCTPRELGMSAVGAATLFTGIFVAHDIAKKNNEKKQLEEANASLIEEEQETCEPKKTITKTVKK